jgi:transcription initiation factor TFIIIB Brf1 subunit/transcription initiation factor TFIIB
MPDEAMPKCPWCGTAKRVYAHRNRNFYCSGCKRIFDGDPNEGGEHSDFDPSWRMEREERRQREQARRRKRRR